MRALMRNYMKRVMVFALTLVCVATQLAAPVSALAASDDQITISGVDFMEPAAEQWELFRADNLDGKTVYIDITKTSDGKTEYLTHRQTYSVPEENDPMIAHIVSVTMRNDEGNVATPQELLGDEADRATYGVAVHTAKSGGDTLYQGTVYPIYAVRTNNGATVGSPALVGIRTASDTEAGKLKNMGLGTAYYAEGENGARETYKLVLNNGVDNALTGNSFTVSYEKTAEGSVDGAVNYVDAEGNIVTSDAVVGLTDKAESVKLRTQFFAEAKSGDNKGKICYFRALTGPSKDSVQLSASNATYVVRVVEVSCDEANAYPVVVRYEDTNGNLLWSDEVDVMGEGQRYTLPEVFSMRGTDGVSQYTLQGAIGAYTKQNNGIELHADTFNWDAPVLNFSGTDSADKFGVDEMGRRVVTAQYRSHEVDKQVTFTIVEVDGESGTEMGRKTYKVTPENDAVYTPEAREVNGTKYLPWTGNTQPLTYTWNDISDGTDLLQYVYYVPEGYVPGSAYDVTVRYQDIATGNVLRTQTIAVDPEIVDYVNILGEERFSQGGEEYVRLAGQETPVRHAYFSSARTYTVYYRNVNDTINAQVVIRRTQIINSERVNTLPVTGAAAAPAQAGTAPAAAAATPVATGVTAGTPADAGVTPGDGTVVVNDDGNPLANLEGQDTASERVEDDANPLARGGAMTTGIIAGSLAALAALGLLAFWFFKRKKKDDETSDPQSV